jgi:hypothetical protein
VIRRTAMSASTAKRALAVLDWASAARNSFPCYKRDDSWGKRTTTLRLVGLTGGRSRWHRRCKVFICRTVRRAGPLYRSEAGTRCCSALANHEDRFPGVSSTACLLGTGSGTAISGTNAGC